MRARVAHPGPVAADQAVRPDPDAGATRTFSIIDGADKDLFTIDSTTGVLKLLRLMNLAILYSIAIQTQF